MYDTIKLAYLSLYCFKNIFNRLGISYIALEKLKTIYIVILFIVYSINFISLGSELYCTTTSLESIDDEYKSTTIACSVTTALNNIQMPESVIIVRNAQSYVESLTTEELVELENLLNDKELTMEDTKVQDDINIKVYEKKLAA